jgi:uncharacterized protein YbaR (Trm112 family)
MKLLILRCPRCNHNLSPGNDDVVVQCPNCRSAVSIGESGVQLLPVLYAAAAQTPEAWLPFWVCRGHVTIQQRRTQGGRSADEESRAFWAGPRQVYIPAWACPLDEARELMRQLLVAQTRLSAAQPGEVTFTPAAISLEDGRKLLDLVIISIEAGRSDWLQDLSYDMRLDSQVLWLLPARRAGEEWALLLKSA